MKHLKNLSAKGVVAALLAVSTLSVSSCTSNNGSEIPANKKELMDAFVAGTLDESYVPGAFFVHFDANSKVGEGAVRSHINYLLQTNADVLKVQFEQAPMRLPTSISRRRGITLPPCPRITIALRLR